jgi:hypothetical protein
MDLTEETGLYETDGGEKVMKRLSILGSTGSIGRNVLKIVEMFP